MKPQPLTRIQTAFLLGAVITWGLITIYLGIISLASIFVGLGRLHQQGFWVPILAGATILTMVSWISFRLAKRLFTQRREEDVVHLHST
jgi:uncharacterized membrane protein YvlD (DUF360 family)